MRSLPRNAQIYLITVMVLGLATLVLTYDRPHVWVNGRELLLFLILAALTSGKKIRLGRQRGEQEGSRNEDGQMSLEFAVSFAAMLQFGAVGALPVALLGTLGVVLFPRRQLWYQILFNLAITALDVWVAATVFLWINGAPHPSLSEHSLLAVIAAITASFIINTCGISAIIAFCTDQKLMDVWRENFVWTGPAQFTSGAVSAAAVLIMGRHTGGILIFMAPIIYFTHQLYTLYTSRVEEKQQHIESMADLYLATVKSLALAIDAKDQYTHQHILRVQRYAVATAIQMGMTGDELEGLKTGALLHDIGKLGVPEYVLLKPGRLTDEEFEKIKQHPTIGAAILDPVTFPWPVVPVVKHHHEKWDGTGYPDGLAGEDIPLTARILSVGDVYDALTSNRSYRHAWPHERALELIQKQSGVHFDPVAVKAFSEVIDRVREEMQEDIPVVSASETPAPPTKSEEAVRAIQRASSELWALYEVSQTLSASLSLSETLDILARKLQALLPGIACLFLMHEEGGGMAVRAAVGLNNEFFKGGRTLGPESVSLGVAHDRITYAGAYDPDDLMLTASTVCPWEEIWSALIVPIVHQGQVLGTINLYHPQVDAFSAHDRQLLETIAERSAMALHNGLLFERTRSHAFTDPLTGLYNLRYFTDWVEDRCAPEGAAEKPFALLCLDLDSFKPINDNFGHQKGDQVLKDLAKIFRSQVREQDIVARYGGDEFLIILEGAGSEEARTMAARMQRAVEDYNPGLVHPKLGALRLGVSIGFGCFPTDGLDGAALISRADAQMYDDKTERKLRTLAPDRSRVQPLSLDRAA
jgi:diguanylate cyclase (GGDEF)-like protein/putative nucleotidyltransferase with HDIG domain